MIRVTFLARPEGCQAYLLAIGMKPFRNSVRFLLDQNRSVTIRKADIISIEEI